jgi:hypothetical protein
LGEVLFATQIEMQKASVEIIIPIKYQPTFPQLSLFILLIDSLKKNNYVATNQAQMLLNLIQFEWATFIKGEREARYGLVSRVGSAEISSTRDTPRGSYV